MAQSQGGQAVSDTPRMKAAQIASIEHMTGDVYRVGCDIERELTTANERIKRLEEMYEGKIGENEQFLGSNLQGLLTRELNAANERIKRLDETLEGVTDKIDNAWGIYMKFKEAKP